MFKVVVNQIAYSKSKNFIAEFKQVVFVLLDLYKTMNFLEKIMTMDYNKAKEGNLIFCCMSSREK